MLATDYIDDIDFSVCFKKSHSSAKWKNLLEKVKKEEKSYSEKDYAFGIYQILPCPPNVDHIKRYFQLKDL